MNEERKHLYQDQLLSGKWFERPLVEQLANVGADFDRAILWKNKGYIDRSEALLERAFEFLSFTIQDPKNEVCLEKLYFLKNALIDHFRSDNHHQTTDEFWQRYFYAFNHAYAIGKGK